MIAVEFWDFDMPGATRMRQGVLLQVGSAHARQDPVTVAYVITDRMGHDSNYHAKPGERIILPVQLQYVRVKGTSIPLFGS